VPGVVGNWRNVGFVRCKGVSFNTELRPPSSTSILRQVDAGRSVSQEASSSGDSGITCHDPGVVSLNAAGTSSKAIGLVEV